MSFLGSVIGKFVERLPPVGFTYEEEMLGELSFIEKPLELRRVELKFRVVVESALKLSTERTARIEGIIDIEGLADTRPIEGSVTWRIEERRIPYVFSFTTDDGRVFTFRAQKDFSVFRVDEFVKHLEGTIYGDGPVEVARVYLRRPFVRALGDMAKSFHVKI